jgi:hypothetical protein
MISRWAARWGSLVGLAALAAIPLYSQAGAAGEPARRPSAPIIRGKQSGYKVGEEVRIQVSWKNNSDQPIFYAPEIPTADTSYKVYVEDDKGNPAPETSLGRRVRTGTDEFGHTTIRVFKTAPGRTIAPGESVSEEIVLNKLYDLSKPGRYAVRLNGRDDPDGSSPSNTLTITLTDPNEPKK